MYNFLGNVLLLLHTVLIKPDLKCVLSIATFQALHPLSFEFLLQGIVIVISFFAFPVFIIYVIKFLVAILSLSLSVSVSQTRFYYTDKTCFCVYCILLTTSLLLSLQSHRVSVAFSSGNVEQKHVS